ncbi:glycoside-pentoside-hexuronide (GPH):cation symporter [Streptococcus moroccensis]|uniref:GPH family glycoside/pentoside/hexuronide:cation symporter n=1 Tax=Streptococcus moroccensis TaxID=1451356 RepID=A0ABT9YPJ0_9STRE|nr:glycoside-pentoside-hexuronide (GPH):cation symporter [Streptococcus moroccensis]MDQ0221807.1 GPH family glycoside/pentoside/hexuronide:cation symporter [Streptococcus moroccensis]
MIRKPKKDKNAIRYDRDGIQKVMRVRDYFADSLGMFSLNVISGLVGQLTYFYTDKVGLAAGAIATIFMVNKIFDAFTDVIMGNIIDNTKPGKEKYRPWLLKAGVPAGLMLITMFMVPNGTDIFQLGYVMATNLLLTSVLYTAMAVPYVSLQLVRTRSQEERSYIGTWRAAAGYVSGMFIAILVIPVTNMLGGDKAAWIKLAAIFGALVVIAMLICFAFAKESAVDSKNKGEVVESVEEEQMTMRDALSKLVKNKYWMMLLVVNVAINISYGLTGTSGTYYAKWIYGNDNLVAVMGGLGLIPTFLGFALLTPLVKKFGPTKLLKYMALITVVLTTARIVNPDHFIFNTAIGLVTTFTGIPIMALTGVLMGMVVDYNDYKFGSKMIGRSSSAHSFANKIGTGIGASMVGWCLALASYDGSAAVATEPVRQAIFTFSIYIPLLLNLAIFLALRKFDLEGRMVEIYAAIAERRAGGESKEAAPAIEKAEVVKGEVLLAPVAGQTFSLQEVNDPAFSNGAIGQGIAIKPSEGVLYAPADGQVSLAFATGHAVNIVTPNGAEIFVHIGIDTVTMNGNGFELKIAQGDFVKAGDIIGNFDKDKIAAAGLIDTTVLLVTNTKDYTEIKSIAADTVAKADKVLELKA